MPGYNNGDFAVNLGSNLPQLENISNQLYERGLRRQAEQDRLAREQQTRQDMLTKYVGDQFDNKDYLSGTECDPHINDLLKASLQKHADMIRKNPDISMADLSYSMAGDAANIHSIAEKAKAVSAGLDARTKDYSKEKGMDGGALNQIAKMMTFNNYDPKTGAWTPKKDSEIDPAHDYLKDVIDNHPDLYLNEGKAWDAAMETYRKKKADVGNKFKTEFAGRGKMVSYTGSLYPFQQVLMDKNKKEILDPQGRAQWGLAAQPLTLDDKPVMMNGEQMQGMTPEIYNQFISDPVNNAILINDLHKFNKEHAKDGVGEIKNGTPEADIIKNNALYKRFKAEKADFRTADETSESTWREKADAGYGRGLTDLAKAITAKNKQDQKLEGTDFGRILRGLGGDGAVLEGADPVDVNGKTMYNVTNIIGGMKLGFTKDPTTGVQKTRHAEGVYIDPVTKTVAIKDENGQTETYTEKEIRKKFKNVADFNGVNGDKIHSLLNLHMDENGKYIGPQNKEVIADMQVKQRLNEAGQRKVKAAAASAVNDYSSTGDFSALSPLKGVSGTVGGKKYKIADIQLNPGTFVDDAVITLQDENGDLQTKKISRPKSGSEFKAFLKNFIQ